MSSHASVDAMPPVVRMAGLSTGDLYGLRSERTFALVQELIMEREWLRVEGSVLAVALHMVIGERAGNPDKPALVGLRRALHQGRAPAAREWNDRLAAVLSAPLRERAAVWVSRQHSYAKRRAWLPDILEGEATAAAAALRRAAGAPYFRRALHQASPALSAELEKWLADERRVPRRQSLLTLAKYVARAAAKTSPYSTFTISGLGTWVDDGPAVRMITSASVGCVSDLYGTLAHSLSHALCEDPRLQQALPLRLNPSASFQPHSVMFIRSRPQESIVTMPATPAILACSELLGDGATLTPEELCAKLAGEGGDKSSVERFVTALVEAGLLECQFPVADQKVNPLGELSAWLEEHAPASMINAVALVNRLRDSIDRSVPVIDVEGHQAHQRELGDAARAVASQVGRPLEQSRIVHESAVFPQTVAECSLPKWRLALHDLDVLRRWLAALDPGLPGRIAVGAYCRERFGSGSRVPLLLLQRAIYEEVALPDASDRSDAAHDVARLFRPMPPLGRNRLPRLLHLDRIQREAREIVFAQADDNGVIRLDPDVLARLAANWPEWIRAASSLGCYVQPLDRGGALHLVINGIGLGHGRGHNRVRQLIQRAGGALAVMPGRLADPTLCELGATFGLPMNQRVPGLPYEIGYPMAVSDRPREEQIPLSDLEVVHDQRTDLALLYSQRLGRQVGALHLGMMSDLYLPPTARFLVQAFGPSSVLIGSGISVLTPEEVTTSPRVEVGRVIMQRARWVISTEELPFRQAGASDSEYLLLMVTWLQAQDIPSSCFVRMWSAGLSQEGEAVFDKSRKPVFVDFANLYLVAVFERMLRRHRGPVVVFEEALPAPASGLAHVTEFLIEANEPGRADG